MSASYLFSQVEGASPCAKALFVSKGGAHDSTGARRTAIVAGPRMPAEI
jgi:hypothetical protein